MHARVRQRGRFLADAALSLSLSLHAFCLLSARDKPVSPSVRNDRRTGGDWGGGLGGVGVVSLAYVALCFIIRPLVRSS